MRIRSRCGGGRCRLRSSSRSALIVTGGFLILRRLHLVGIAVGFWLAFATGIGVLAASGHTMTAAWHVGPIEGRQFWWLLVSSPEILVFLFFMITDPKTIPSSSTGRRAYAVAVGLLATLLIAPQTTEFATKVAILSALALVCAARGAFELVGAGRMSALRSRLSVGVPTRWPRPAAAGAVLFGGFAFAALVFAAGIPARPDATAASASGAGGGPLPEVVVTEGRSVASIDQGAAATIARDLLADLRVESQALRSANKKLAATAASGAWLASLWDTMGASSPQTTVARYDVDRMVLTLQRGAYQGPPTVVANLQGTLVASTYGRSATFVSRRTPQPFRRTVELTLEDGRYRIVRSDGGLPLATPSSPTATGTLGGTSFVDVAHQVGLDFRQGAFRLRDDAGHDRDDGRRSLLARLRQRRLDRPLRRQLARGQRHRSRGYARRSPPNRSLPQRGGQIRGRVGELRRQPADSRRRLRGGRLQHGRSHRSLRDQRRVQRRDELLGRAPLEQRRRDLHRGRRAGGHQGNGMALRRGRRRRERRRSTGSLRLVVYGPEPRRRPGIRLPVGPRARPRSPLSERRARLERAFDVPRGRSTGGHREDEGRHTASERSSRTSTTTGGSTCTWRTTRIPTSSTRTWR